MPAMHLPEEMSKEDITCYHEYLHKQLEKRPAARRAYFNLMLRNYQPSHYERDELAICQRIAQQAVINRTK